MLFLKNNVIKNRLIVLLAGAFVPFAFAPCNFYFISFLSLLVLFNCWQKTTSSGECFLLGYLFAFAMFGIGVNWLHISINLFGGVNFIGALFFTYSLVAFISLYPALCGYIVTRFFNQYRLIAIAPIWVLTEWCRGWVLTGFPWLNIGTSQTDNSLSAFIPVFGDYGVSFIVCLITILFLGILTGKSQQRFISIIFLITIIICASLLNKHDWTQALDKKLSVTLIQGAIPQKVKWKPEQRQKTYDIYTELSEDYWSSDLIIWPETAIPSYYHRADDFLDGIKLKKENNNALFMSGLAYKDQEKDKYFNSVLLIDDDDSFYHKHHLVPFGEYLPFKSILDEFLKFLKIPMSDFSAGEPKNKLFITDRAVFGMSICYEDAYSNEIRRSIPEANILVNISNDAWFGDSWAPHQHLQIARMRALENGRYLLRSTNTGISAIIDNKGKIVASSPQFKPHALHSEVKLYSGSTPFGLYGNAFIVSISLFILVIIRLFQQRGKEKTNAR